jgi:hypothetical protein
MERRLYRLPTHGSQTERNAIPYQCSSAFHDAIREIVPTSSPRAIRKSVAIHRSDGFAMIQHRYPAVIS